MAAHNPQTEHGETTSRSKRLDKSVLVALITAGATIVAAVVTGAAGVATGYLGVSASGSAGEPRPTVTVTTTQTVGTPGAGNSAAGGAPSGLATPAPGVAARIGLQPDQGVAKGKFTVTGEGFAPGERVRIGWESEYAALRDVDADAQGRFKVEVAVPDELSGESLPGSHHVVTRGTESKRKAEHVFVVVDVN